MFNTVEPKDPKTYRIGIDAGIRGIGLAALEVDDDGFVIDVLASTTVRIDGGMMPGTAKSPVSRKAKAGVARRVRRLVRRKRARLNKLDQILKSLGYPVTVEAQTYEPWEARAELASTNILDEDEKKRLVSVALRHIARHRGWRNPWLSWATFSELPVPSSNHKKNVKAAEERFGRDLDGYTIGQLGYLGADKAIQIRPRTAKRGLHEDGQSPLFAQKVLQEDHLDEIKQIWAMQDLPVDHFKPLVESVFYQSAPHVPLERVGKDVLPGMSNYYRATRASIEFQEYRIRAAIGNLRIRDRGLDETRPLTLEENNVVYELLSTWHLNDGMVNGVLPTWSDVATKLDVRASDLRGRDSEESAASRPPIMRSLADLDARIRGLKAGIRKPIQEWLDKADQEQISALISWLTDATRSSDNLLERSGLADIISDWDETALESLANIDLEAGRAAYSPESLRRLNSRMAAEGVDVHTARKLEFDVDDKWTPPLPRLDELIDHPTADQNLAYVRKFVMSAVRRWGLPQAANVEHVRDAFLGPTALAEQQRENRQRANRREQELRSLEEVLGQKPTRRDVRRHEYVQRQNSKCAYCESMITVFDCELDHVVPRSGGGSTNRANLVAVCRSCNSRKGNIPFAVWASNDSRMDDEGHKLISVKKTTRMINSWLNPHGSTSAFRSEIRELIQRISQTEEDAVDERSMESTAYAALAIRDRLVRFFSDIAESAGAKIPAVSVYQGSIVAAARKTSEVDHLIQLRGQTEKNRGDFRHHALDAAVIAMMNTSVAQTLSHRGKMRAANNFTYKEPGWKDFTGFTPGARESFAKWKLQMHSLAVSLNDAIQQDRVSVQNPLRLSRNVGAVHEETILPLIKKQVDSAWTMAEINRIVDRDEYLMLSRAAKNKALKEIPEPITQYFEAQGQKEITLFSTNASQIAVRGGGAKLGAIHHARILAWKDRRGNIKFGMQRVYAGEIQQMWPDKSVDILTAEVPEWSMSRRDLLNTVANQLEAGNLAEVCWIAPGDELQVEQSVLATGTNVFARALRAFPEKRWCVVGFPDAGRVAVKPLFISSEREAQTDEEKAIPWEKIYVSVEDLMSNSLIVRRNVLGEIRNGSRYLPSTTCPLEIAKSVLK